MQITKLKQEDLSGSCIVISYRELNLEGKMLTKFETCYFSNNDHLMAIILIFPLTGDCESLRKYKAITLLSECLYTGSDFKTAMRHRI